MSNYRDVLNANQRLNILRSLHEMPGYQANESIVHTVLEKYGHQISRDQVRSQLSWLAEQGLIDIERVGDIQVAILTARGGDIALGRAAVPGVKRPEPRL